MRGTSRDVCPEALAIALLLGCVCVAGRVEVIRREPLSKEYSPLTQQAFDALLACLDSDRERAAEKYETLRLKLVKFFEWRACAVAAQDLADEVINRVARRIDGGE